MEKSEEAIELPFCGTPEQAEAEANIRPMLEAVNGIGEIFKHKAVPGVFYSEGAKFMAEKCAAWWLVDFIASYQPAIRKWVAQSKKNFKGEIEPTAGERIPCDLDETQIWEMKVAADGSAKILLHDGRNKNPWHHRRLLIEPVPETDFPLNWIKIYFMDNTIMLPNEW